MSLRLIVRPVAEQDLTDAQDWYDEQRPGLGAEFRDLIDHTMRRILETPRLYPEVYQNVRRVVLRRFPYLLYYVLTGEAVVILACLHGKRDPALIESRLS